MHDSLFAMETPANLQNCTHGVSRRKFLKWEASSGPNLTADGAPCQRSVGQFAWVLFMCIIYIALPINGAWDCVLNATECWPRGEINR
jgi:hypothetical protein